MTQWSTTTKHEPESINNGRKYELRDRVSIEQLNNMTENAFYAMQASSEAKEKAEEALSFAQGSGTTVFENGSPVAEFNADKKADKTEIPTEYVKDIALQYNDETDEMGFYYTMSSGHAYGTEIPYVREYIKKVTISDNLLILTNQDDENITFGGGGSKVIWEVWE